MGINDKPHLMIKVIVYGYSYLLQLIYSLGVWLFSLEAFLHFYILLRYFSNFYIHQDFEEVKCICLCRKRECSLKREGCNIHMHSHFEKTLGAPQTQGKDYL